MVSKTWFVLPPLMEYYYASSNPNYKILPPYLNACYSEESQRMAFIYPKPNEDILIPKDLGNRTFEVIFKLAHQQPESTVHWYLDDTYLGTTASFHELIRETQIGDYRLTVVDDKGNRIQQNMSVKMASGN